MKFTKEDFLYVWELFESSDGTFGTIVGSDHQLDNEYRRYLSGFYPAFIRNEWRTTVAFYESPEGYKHIFSDANSGKPVAKRMRISVLLLNTARYLLRVETGTPVEDQETSLYAWLLSDEAAINSKKGALREAARLLKLAAFIYDWTESANNE